MKIKPYHLENQCKRLLEKLTNSTIGKIIQKHVTCQEYQKYRSPLLDFNSQKLFKNFN